MKIILVTGGFDPLHSGHIEYFNCAKELGDKLVVGINSDSWLRRKKGQAFMSWDERMTIISHLSMVNWIIEFDDSDDTAIDAIHKVKQRFPDDTIIFANGGDRTKENIPEMSIDNVEFVFGVGGDYKSNSSSQLLEEWRAPKTFRTWGHYRVVRELPGTKVKELTIEPGQSLSMQRHQFRSEYWFVAQGACQIETELSTMQVFAHDEMVKIPLGKWHKLSNPFEKPCQIIEIQYGSKCEESDIERLTN